jgi:hypothetical protein
MLMWLVSPVDHVEVRLDQTLAGGQLFTGRRKAGAEPLPRDVQARWVLTTSGDLPSDDAELRNELRQPRRRS